MAIEIASSYSRIRAIEGNNPVGGIQTGVLYATAQRQFVAINQHTLCGHCPIPQLLGDRHQELAHFRPTHIRMQLPMKDDPRTFGDVNVPLFADGLPRWVISPQHRAIDLALIPIEEGSIPDTLLVSPWPEERCFPSDFLYTEEESCYTVRFHGREAGREEYHNARLLTPHQEDWSGFPFFLIDVPIVPGESGSPVIVRPAVRHATVDGRTVEGDFEPYLLGICVGRTERDENSPTAVIKASVLVDTAKIATE